MTDKTFEHAKGRDIIVHFDEKGQPLFLEFLRDSKAGKIVPLLVEGLAKRELTVD